MKKKISIVSGLVFLSLLFTYCEQSDEMEAFKYDDEKIVVDPESKIHLEPTTLSKEELNKKCCGKPKILDLFAGQHIKIGKVLVANDNKFLYIRYDTSGSDWWIKETHLFVGDESEIPYTGSGNPKIGHFPYHCEKKLKQEKTFAIPIDKLDDCYMIIAHAVVVKKINGELVQEETAFAYGDHEFPGKRWGWYYEYCQQECNGSDDKSDDDDNSDDSDDDENNDKDSDDDNDDNDDDDDNQGNSGNDNNQDDDLANDNGDDGCMDAFAFNPQNSSNSYCFTEDGFNQWGWTNLVEYNQSFDHPNGFQQRFPVYASAYQCDTSNSIEVGYFELTIAGGDGRYLANANFVLTHNDLVIKELKLYVGTNKYPTDNAGDWSLSNSNFNLSLSDLNLKSYQVNNIQNWDINTYFIAYLKVCPEPIVP